LQKVKAYAQKRPDHSLSECLLMWVIEEVGRKPVSKEQQVQVAQEKLKQIKADLEALGLQVKTEVRVGNPYLEVLDAATVFDIRAIAVSSETIGSIIELPIRSFAGELMRRSWHPVLFFPPPPS